MIIDPGRSAILLSVIAAIDVLRSGIAVALTALPELLRASVLLRTPDRLRAMVVSLIAALALVAVTDARSVAKSEATAVGHVTFCAAVAVGPAVRDSMPPATAVLSISVVCPATTILTTVALTATVAVVAAVAALTAAIVAPRAAIAAMTSVSAA